MVITESEACLGGTNTFASEMCIWHHLIKRVLSIHFALIINTSYWASILILSTPADRYRQTVVDEVSDTIMPLRLATDDGAQ